MLRLSYFVPRAALLSLSLTLAVSAAADEYSEYERVTIERALAELHAQLDPAPEGKLIEQVIIWPLEVFDDRDPVPDFVNVFHTTSRKRIIRRELLFEVGRPYEKRLVDESERNLRELHQLSLVLIVALRGSTDGRVRVLVITKDVWSLRLNSDFTLNDFSLRSVVAPAIVGTAASLQLGGNLKLSYGELTYLLLNPSETNLFGTHTSVGALFLLRPDTYSFGLRFSHPRVLGTRLRTSASANVIFNRDTGNAEGSFGSFFYGQPLYSIATEWAYKVAIVWRSEVSRSFIGNTLRTYDALATPGVDDAIPFIWHTDLLLGAYELVRSFGRTYKYDFSVGVELDHRRYRTLDLSRFDPAAAAEFVRAEVPVSDTRASPFVQLRSYTTRFLRVLNFETLGLQEDYRLGHEAILRFYPASSAVVSTRDMLGSLAALSYTAALGDGLVRVLGASTIELDLDKRHDASIELGARVITPRLGFARILYDAVLFNRYQNYYNRQFVLGGEGRLRGYRPSLFRGKDQIAQNIELRTRPVDIFSAQVGGAVFYDVGDAFNGFDKLNLKQSAGLGARILFPQIDRIVLRADWGFPLSRGYSSWPGSVFLTFGQAFGMPSLQPPTVTDLFSAEE